MTETVVKRKTYKQNWPAYNAAQTTEKAWFTSLLADLCSGIQEPERKPGRGRPPVKLADSIFAACFKVFSGHSARRFTCDLEAAAEDGFISRKIHFNSVLNIFDTDVAAPILTELIQKSATPLRGIETQFAIDSTGFSGCRFDRHFNEKRGVPTKRAAWVKAHAIVGTRTHVITAAVMNDGGDSPMLPELMNTTAKTFTVKELSADKGCLSIENYEEAEKIGVDLYAMFKANTTGAGGGAFERAYHAFCLDRDGWLDHYHRRSNVETVFSMVKRVLGDSTRSKNVRAMRSECLAKMVCHNIRCVVSAIYERGIDPTFLGIKPRAESCDVLRFPSA